MVIICNELYEIVKVCNHLQIEVRPHEFYVSFPYRMELKTVNGETMPEGEVTFKEFETKYIEV